MQTESERLLEKGVVHHDATRELEEEAKAAGRILTKEETDYLGELHQEGDQILETADRASKEAGLRAHGKIVVADVSGNLLLNDRDLEDARNGTAKHTVSGSRLAD